VTDTNQPAGAVWSIPQASSVLHTNESAGRGWSIHCQCRTITKSVEGVLVYTAQYLVQGVPPLFSYLFLCSLTQKQSKQNKNCGTEVKPARWQEVVGKEAGHTALSHSKVTLCPPQHGSSSLTLLYCSLVYILPCDR
jgi:hypothetical protein